MNKNDFNPDTRYTIAWRDPTGRVRPCAIYVFRAYDAFLIARLTGGDALLRKFLYSDVFKIVAAESVAPSDRYLVPAALLDEKTWAERVEMSHYATSPASGK